MTDLPIVDVDLHDTPSLTAWATAASAVFLQPYPTAESIEARQRRMAGHRLYAARDGARTVATFRSFDSDVSLPGARTPLPVNAVSSVTVLPTHRRRRLLSRWMAAETDRAQQRGTVATILIAAEAAIYRRFGFGPATTACTWTVDAGRAVFTSPRTGSMQLVDRETFVDLAPAVYDAARAGHPGAIGRPPARWRTIAQLELSGNDEDRHVQLAVHRDARGDVDGVLVYKVDEAETERVSHATLHVRDLWAASDTAYADLWRYCCEVDFVTRVVAHDRSPHEPLPLLLADPRTARDGATSDFLWVRLHDVAAALTARAYAVPGRLTLRVADPAAAFGGRTVAGGYVLEVDGAGRATCTRDDDLDVPDLELDASTLATLWLGGAGPGAGLDALARAGQVRARDAATLTRASALLGWPQPAWCGTWF